MKKTTSLAVLALLTGGFIWSGLQRSEGAVPAYTDFFLCDQPNFVVGRFPAEEAVKETAMYFRILGKVEVPTAGYSYTLHAHDNTADEGKDGDNGKTLDLILKAPEAAAAQVISSLGIDETLKFGESVTDIVIDVSNPAAKDAPHKKISCTLEAE